MAALPTFVIDKRPSSSPHRTGLPEELALCGELSQGAAVKPRVLFVSKPIVEPFHDGTKCLVRDIARHLSTVRPLVLGVPGATAPLLPDGSPAWEVVPVYTRAGHYTPSLSENLRAALWVSGRSQADVWHFVFAPNPRSSTVGRLLRTLRRKPVLQTVASPPRDMSRPDRLLFGDVVVAQSRWTAARLQEGYATVGRPPPRLEVVPPPVPSIAPRSSEALAAVRQQLELPADAKLFVYPGDLEVGTGAERVARLVAPLVAADPRVYVVFAYRQKTSRADAIAAELAARLSGQQVRFARQLEDVLALIQSAVGVLFPVDDLWGKVDLPIVLLESMSLGVPVLALDQGPLQDLEGARLLPADDGAWLEAARALLGDGGRELGAAGRAAVERRFRAERIAARYEQLYLELLAERRRGARAAS